MKQSDYVMLETDLKIYIDKCKKLEEKANECAKTCVELEDRIDRLICWGEALEPEFQQIMLEILKGEE